MLPRPNDQANSLTSTNRRRPLVIATAQGCVRWFCRMTLTLLFRIRVHGLKNYPSRDGFLICANHQSHLDPVVLGSICPRPINYLGRESLFKFKPFGWFLAWNDTIPIDRDGGGIAGLKETLRRLKKQETVLIFPEGTRTRDGNLQPIKLGFSAVARRAKAPLLPMAMSGPYAALPPRSWKLKLVPIQVVIGKPIFFSEYEGLSDEALGNLLTERLSNCFQRAESLRESARMKTA